MPGGDQQALGPLCLAAAAGAAALLAVQHLGKLVGVSRRSTTTDGSKVAAAAVDGASLFAAGWVHPMQCSHNMALLQCVLSLLTGLHFCAFCQAATPRLEAAAEDGGAI